MTRLNTQRNQRRRHPVHIIPELGIGTGVVQRGVLESILVGVTLGHFVQHLRESQVDGVEFLPGVGTGMGPVVIDRLASALFGRKPFHIADKMGQDDIFGGNLGIPVHADKAVIVQRAQRIHEIQHR